MSQRKPFTHGDCPPFLSRPISFESVPSEEARERFISLYGFISGGFWRKNMPELLSRVRESLEAFPVLSKMATDDNEYLLIGLLSPLQRAGGEGK